MFQLHLTIELAYSFITQKFIGHLTYYVLSILLDINVTKIWTMTPDENVTSKIKFICKMNFTDYK